MSIESDNLLFLFLLFRLQLSHFWTRLAWTRESDELFDFFCFFASNSVFFSLESCHELPSGKWGGGEAEVSGGANFSSWGAIAPSLPLALPLLQVGLPLKVLLKYLHIAEKTFESIWIKLIITTLIITL